MRLVDNDLNATDIFQMLERKLPKPVRRVPLAPGLSESAKFPRSRRHSLKDLDGENKNNSDRHGPATRGSMQQEHGQNDFEHIRAILRSASRAVKMDQNGDVLLARFVSGSPETS